MADAQIILSHSREAGIVAMATGEQYPWAHTALTETGFERDERGVYHLPADASSATVADLVRCADRHRTSVSTSSRRFIGDAARDIAQLLPGQWRATVQIYSHPVWQEDLVPWIWDSGELGRALQSERIPYAATLTDMVHGTTLLHTERPGRQLDYLIGAFAPKGLEEGFGDPHAPRSIVLPPFPGRAAQAVADRYLPSYEQAVHARRTAAISTVLQRIRSERDTWQAMAASARCSDATPLSANALGAATEAFLDHAWCSFLTVVDHAPTLLDRCRPASSPWPQDAAALSRLADAVADAEVLLEEAVHSGPLPPQERHARAWPAIETWLTDGETFLRQARVSAPHRRPSLAVSAPLRPPACRPSGTRPLTCSTTDLVRSCPPSWNPAPTLSSAPTRNTASSPPSLPPCLRTSPSGSCCAKSSNLSPANPGCSGSANPNATALAAPARPSTIYGARATPCTPT